MTEPKNHTCPLCGRASILPYHHDKVRDYLTCKRSNATQMLLTAVDQNVVAHDRAGNVGSWRFSGRKQAKSGH